MKDKGFSLMELLVYVAIFVASSIFLISILFIFTRIHLRQTSVNEVNNQLNFVNDNIQRLIRESSLIDMSAGVTTSTITLRMASSTLDPTLIYWNQTEKAIYIQEGSDSPVPLTDSNVVVDNFEVTKYENPGGHDVVQININLSYNTQNPRAKYKRALSTAIGRVSAAVFDSDILPNAGNVYDVGNPSQTWRDAYFSGNVGIGVSPVSSARLKTDGDIAITTSTKGLILTAPGGSCFRLQVLDSGTITTTSAACP